MSYSSHSAITEDFISTWLTSNVPGAKAFSEQSSYHASIWAAAVITAWGFSQEEGALDLAEPWVFAWNRIFPYRSGNMPCTFS